MSGSILNAIANPATVNPLAAYGQALEVQGGINRNKLFQAKQLAGQAFQQSIDPATGLPNQALLNNNLVAAGPNAALASQDAAQAGQTLDNETFTTQTKRLGQLASVTAALIAQNPNGVPMDVGHAAIDREVSNGLLTPEMAATAKAQLGGDPMQNTRVFLQGQARLLDAHQAILSSRPGTGTVDTGQGVQGIQTPSLLSGSPTPGAIAPVGGSVTTGLPSASTLIQPATGPAGPHGEPTTSTVGANLARQGIDPNTGQPYPNPAFANLPAGLRNPNAPKPVAAPIVTGVGPSATNAMAATGTASSANYQDYSTNQTKAVGQRALLQSMAADATQFTTGPGTTTLKDIKSTIQRIGSTLGTSFGIDPTKLAANEDLDKVANQLADAQGAGSDARLSVNQGANPSSHNTPAGLKLILNKLIGNADFIAAKGQLAQTYQQQQDPTGVNAREFTNQVNQQLDPRVFQFNRLDADQQKQYLGELGAGKDAFKKKYLEMKAMQVLPSG